MKQPKITIVTVCYNAEKEIEATLQSVANLTYPNKEYIIIDGGSKDGTLDIINKYRSCIDICVSEKDNGIYDAMNKGVVKANGEWICFMNAGDKFHDKTVLNELMDYDHAVEPIVLYGNVNMVYTTFCRVVIASSCATNMKPMPFNHQSCLVKTYLLQKYKFDVSYKYAADYDFFNRIKKEGLFLKVDVVVADYKVDGVSSENGIMVNLERIHSNPNAYLYYLHAKYLRNYFIKRMSSALFGKSFTESLKRLL